MNPKVSVILLNYNGDDDTIACVDSLRNVTYDNYEVIVVDNASKTQDTLGKRLPPEVIYIKSTDNLGFSGGNNLGIDYAVSHDSEFVLLLNNDTIVESDFINMLIETAKSIPEIGIITGKILYYSKPDYIWYAGGYMNLNRSRIHHLHIRRKNDFEDNTTCVSFATGCLMMIPVSVVKEIGTLNDIFFMYSEDAEYCTRVLGANYKIVYEPKAKIYHKVSASSGGADSKLSQYYRVRNEMYLVTHYANHKIFGSVCCLIRYAKRFLVRQFTFSCITAGMYDLMVCKMGKTDRKL